jgi:hypothetical protein
MSDQNLEKAVRFISDSLKDNTSAKMHELIETASSKFDLTPIQVEQLFRMYAKGKS